MKTTYGHGEDATCYPLNAPYIKFNTAVYHTNISTGGAICLDILKDKTKWSPLYDFSSIIRNILMLFNEPNNASPFNGEASRHYVDCERRYKDSKEKRMALKDEEYLKEKCCEPFKRHADKYAEGNHRELTNHYSKWFPRIIGGKENEEELEALSKTLESLKLKKKKPTTELVPTATATTTTTSSNSVESKDNNAIPTPTPKEPEKKKFDTNKFNKYKKK
jgi:hypothetical protein